MKSSTLIISALIILVTIFSCKKKEDSKEPFSEKFKVTMAWKNLFDNIDLTGGGNSVTVPPGSTIYFTSVIGGEEGLGNGKITITSVEVTRETASGSKTCKFLPSEDKTIGGIGEPAYETTTYNFTLKASDGSVATQGPFVVNVTNTDKIIAVNVGLTTIEGTNKKCFSTIYKTLAVTHDYDCATQYDFYNPKFIEFGLTKDAGNNIYLTSPSLFKSLNVLPEFDSYDCAYRSCKLQSYSGLINFSNVISIQDENTLTYADLQSKINVTENNEKILVKQGDHFMFQTAEGKKGIGMFKNVVPGTSTELLLVYQR